MKKTIMLLVFVFSLSAQDAEPYLTDKSESRIILQKATTYVTELRLAFNIIKKANNRGAKVVETMRKLRVAADKMIELNTEYMDKVEPMFMSCFVGYKELPEYEAFQNAMVALYNLSQVGGDPLEPIFKKFGPRIDNDHDYREVMYNLTDELKRLKDFFHKTLHSCKEKG